MLILLFAVLAFGGTFTCENNSVDHSTTQP